MTSSPLWIFNEISVQILAMAFMVGVAQSGPGSLEPLLPIFLWKNFDLGPAAIGELDLQSNLQRILYLCKRFSLSRLYLLLFSSWEIKEYRFRFCDISWRLDIWLSHFRLGLREISTLGQSRRIFCVSFWWNCHSIYNFCAESLFCDGNILPVFIFRGCSEHSNGKRCSIYRFVVHLSNVTDLSDITQIWQLPEMNRVIRQDIGEGYESAATGLLNFSYSIGASAAAIGFSSLEEVNFDEISVTCQIWQVTGVGTELVCDYFGDWICCFRVFVCRCRTRQRCY